MVSLLRFILDFNNDDHYTESLLTLRSDAYIWYRLRRDGLRNVLFLRIRENGELEFHVCDSESQTYLLSEIRRKTLFDSSPPQSNVYSLKDLKLDRQDHEEKLLKRLLEADGTAALVFSYDAFAQICRNAGENGQQLTGLINSQITRHPIFICLPFQAEELEKCVSADTSDCPVLHEACRSLRAVRELPKPADMMLALRTMLGSQWMPLYDREDEMFHLLLQLAVETPDFTDDLDELRDQAEYLELCRTRRIRFLMPQKEDEQLRPLFRREVRAMLCDSATRDQLRRQTQDLRRHHPDGSICDGLTQQIRWLPEPCPQIIWNDDLAQQAMRLSVPDESKRKGQWNTARRNLVRLWNRPRNPRAIELTTELLRHAHSAAMDKHWDVLDEILDLLEFFSGQLCAPAARNQDLEHLHELELLVIKLYESIYSRSKFDKLDGYEGIIIERIDDTERKVLSDLKSEIQTIKRLFTKPDLSILIPDDNAIENEQPTSQKEIIRREEQMDLLRRTLNNHQAQPQTGTLNSEDDDLSDLSSFTVSAQAAEPSGSAIEPIYRRPDEEPSDPDDFSDDFSDGFSGCLSGAFPPRNPIPSGAGVIEPVYSQSESLQDSSDEYPRRGQPSFDALQYLQAHPFGGQAHRKDPNEVLPAFDNESFFDNRSPEDIFG